MFIGAINARKDPAANPPYLSHFGLEKAPFSPSAAGPLFYVDEEREQCLNMLQHLTQYSEELLLVTGPERVGKTTILEQYLARADDGWKTCQLNGADSRDAGAMVLRAAECFGLPPAQLQTPDLLGVLKEHLDALHQDQTPVLVLDDAHHLSEDALEIVMRLAALEGEHGKLVRTVLFAEPAILRKLASDRFAQIPAPHRLELNPLDEQRTARYLEHRMQAAGFTGPTLFTPKQVRRIYKASGGLPGLINPTAHEVLMERMRADRPGLGALTRLPPAALAGLVAVAVLGGGAWLFRDALFGGSAAQSPVTPPALPPGTTTAPMSAAGGAPIVREDRSIAPTRLAMVLQDGDSLRISCSPGDPNPAADDPPLIRELTPAAAPVPSPTDPAPMPTKLAKPAPESAAAPVAVTEPDAPEPAVDPDVPPPPVEAPANEADTMPAGTTAPESTDAPEEAAPADADSVVPAASTNAKPEIEIVEPNPLTVSAEPQAITLRGRGFRPGAQVTVAKPGFRQVLEREQINVIGDSRIELELEVGEEPASWLIGITSAEGVHSNIARFDVVAETTKEVADRPTEPVPVEPPLKREDAPAQPAPDPSPANPTHDQPAAVKDAPQKTAPARAVASKAAAAPAQPSLAWLRQAPADHYTLQLLAAYEPETVELFLKEHRLPGPLATFRSGRDRDLHLVVQGEYPDKTAAIAAVRQLPPAVRQAKPWPRRIGDVKVPTASAAPSGPTPQAATAAPPTDARAPAGLHQATWLWARDPGRFAVQLVSGSDPQVLWNFLAGAPSPGPLAWYQTRRDGKPWHVLVWGNFATRADAVAATAALPENLRQGEPWLREFAEIHADMSRR